MTDMNAAILEKVIREIMKGIQLKNGATALTLFDEKCTHLQDINRSCKFIIGGPQGDAGLSGR